MKAFQTLLYSVPEARGHSCYDTIYHESVFMNFKVHKRAIVDGVKPDSSQPNVVTQSLLVSSLSADKAVRVTENSTRAHLTSILARQQRVAIYNMYWEDIEHKVRIIFVVRQSVSSLVLTVVGLLIDIHFYWIVAFLQLLLPHPWHFHYGWPWEAILLLLWRLFNKESSKKQSRFVAVKWIDMKIVPMYLC